MKPSRGNNDSMIADHLRCALRRRFLLHTTGGLGAAALASLLPLQASESAKRSGVAGALPITHFTPRARRVIYLFMSGGPAQMDLFDNKPRLREMNGQEIPKSVV